MILEAKEICKAYEGSGEVLKGVSLQIQEGESLAIMGKSGEGKSTLLHILGTLETPSSGEVHFFGKPVSPHVFATLRNQQIGFIFQSYHLLEDFTALENVLMPLRIKREKADEAYGMQLLEEVGLAKRAQTLAKFLSGGEKQRLAIARALCNKPKLLLADEPTGNLDEAHSIEIQDLLFSCVKKRNNALIVVTHDKDFAARCSRTLYLKEGRLYTESL